MDKKQYKKIRNFILEEENRKNKCQCKDKSYSEDELDRIVEIKYLYQVSIYRKNRIYKIYRCSGCNGFYDDNFEIVLA